MNLLNIYEGWRNDLFPPEKLKELINQVSEERLAICRSCIAYDETGTGCAVPFTQPCCNKNVNVDGVQGCGCPLKKKSKCLSCACPANKWKAVITPEQEEEIDKNGR